MDVDWAALFGLSQPWGETVVRGTAVYWFLVILFRLVIRRDIGSVGIADILVVVIIADAAQNAMAGDYKSITDGFLLIGTIVFWNMALDVIAFYFPAVARLAEPKPLMIIRDGRLLRRNMRQEFLTEAEVQSQLRAHGIENIKEVKVAVVEADGNISVIQHQRE